MIVEWTKDRVNVIPCLGSGGLIVSKVVLLPGFNDIPDDQWNQARINAKDDIDRKIIVEVSPEKKEEKIKAKDPKSGIETETTVVSYTGKSLKKMTPTEAEDIVKGTFNLMTLKKWNKAESRDSIKAAIMNQIDMVEKYGEDQAKQKNTSKGNE